jgi:hypothetical protein
VLRPKNGDHAIGLFQGLFDKNGLTFGISSFPQRLPMSH